MPPILLCCLYATLAWCCAANGQEDDPPRGALIRPPVLELRMRASATLLGPKVLIADVIEVKRASLAGSAADSADLTELSQWVLHDGLAPGARLELTHDDVLERLADADVNLARLRLSGAWRCVITSPASPAVDAVPAAEDDALESDAPSYGARRLLHNVTLEERIRDHVSEQLRALGGTVETQFEAGAEDALALSEPEYAFVIHGADARLGAHDLRIELLRGGVRERTLRVAVHTALLKRVLVSRTSLNAGVPIREDHLETAERLFTEAAQVGLTDLNEAVGQVARRFIPAGQMIRAGDLKRVDQVMRSQRVIVETRVGGVTSRQSGVALDAGAYGEPVRVRIGEGRRKRIVHAIVSGVAEVTVQEGSGRES